ncbi:hypothetical protein OIO90_002766 [Microbotryomycetes sp. JL221]|nr:hypothetical protein OIO90_002766 [Microbotryomycetes sp. JL221]
MRVLQAGLLLKSLVAALLWTCCLYSWGGKQLPEWTHLAFRQPHCFESTAIVSFFVPLRKSHPDEGRSKAILGIYTAFWFVILVLGSYWSFRAPIVLRHRGGFLNSKPRRDHISKKFLLSSEALAQHRRNKETKVQEAERKGDEYYTASTSEEDDGMLRMTMRSLPKGDQRKKGSQSQLSLGAGSGDSRLTQGDTVSGSSKEHSATASRPARSPGKERFAQAWTEREIEIRHHFIIWPAVAVLLVFCILTIELQIALNDLFPDFDIHPRPAYGMVRLQSLPANSRRTTTFTNGKDR